MNFVPGKHDCGICVGCLEDLPALVADLPFRRILGAWHQVDQLDITKVSFPAAGIMLAGINSVSDTITIQVILAGIPNPIQVAVILGNERGMCYL